MRRTYTKYDGNWSSGLGDTITGIVLPFDPTLPGPMGSKLVLGIGKKYYYRLLVYKIDKTIDYSSIIALFISLKKFTTIP